MLEVYESPVAPTHTPRPERGPRRTPRPNRRPDRNQRPDGRPGKVPEKRPTRPRTNEVADGSVSDMEYYETTLVGPKPLENWLDSGTEKARKIVWGVGPHMPE
ncbi:hypothetical protein FGB62_76g095 [Gracilaria domingensis]|nr:hypothetical protein FGB62_76g095 [Gracilaria domingensis]